MGVSGLLHTPATLILEKKTGCPLNVRRCGSNSRSERSGEETNLERSAIPTPDSAVPSTVTIPTK